MKCNIQPFPWAHSHGPKFFCSFIAVNFAHICWLEDRHFRLTKIQARIPSKTVPVKLWQIWHLLYVDSSAVKTNWKKKTVFPSDRLTVILLAVKQNLARAVQDVYFGTHTHLCGFVVCLFVYFLHDIPDWDQQELVLTWELSCKWLRSTLCGQKEWIKKVTWWNERAHNRLSHLSCAATFPVLCFR